MQPFGDRRARRLAAIAVVGLALAGAGFGWRVGWFGGPLAWARVLRLVPTAVAIVPGVYLLGGLAPSAAYAIDTSEGIVLFDTGLDPNATRLRAQLNAVGIGRRPLRAIFLTHVHGDHTGGAAYLRSLTGAKVYAGRDDAATLEAGGPREAFFSTFHMPNSTPHATTVDIPLAGGESFRFGNVRVNAIATPGHTPGSVCYLVEKDGLRIFVAGDIIMRLTRDDPPHDELGKPLGTYAAYLAPRYRGDARDLLATLRRLRALPVPDLVLPGHPSADPSPQDPRLSPARWRAILDDGARDMETLLARYAADGADFLDDRPKRLLADLFYLGQDPGGPAIYALYASGKLYLINAPRDPDLVAARLRDLGLPATAPSAVLLTGTGPKDLGGLASLALGSTTKVVAPRAGLAAARAATPPGIAVVDATRLDGPDWPPLRAIPLAGRGAAPVAYALSLGGKSVLFTGTIPIKVTQETGLTLVRDFRAGAGDVDAYLASLDLLAPLKPDLWLPASPTDAQNANLYDHDWSHTIDDNRAGIRLNEAALRGLPR